MKPILLSHIKQSELFHGARRPLSCLPLTFLLALAAVLLPSYARAQEFRATISGVVADPSGAVVPNATVTITEINTGTLNKTISDSAGQYVVPFLLPGTYSITASAPGSSRSNRRESRCSRRTTPSSI